MKTEKEVRSELKRIRERVSRLSGFWIGEAAAAIYALEWAQGKRQDSPSEDIGKARGGAEKVAASLVRLAGRHPPRAKKSRTASSRRGKSAARRS
ncbi:MAG TPA: hypothetical protein VEG84_09925 [Thermoanaerobaculia bacterium]|nr:hypothetical protein [Thermoanaerobaculia bacterium]